MTSLILIGILSAWSPSASAMGRGSNPCEPAMDEFCGGILEQGHDQLVQCLKEHESELPESCKALLVYKKGAPAQSDSTNSK